MFCHNCGASNPDGSKFCSSCGTSFVFNDENKVERIEYQLPPVPKANTQNYNSGSGTKESSGYDSLALGLSILGLFCCCPSSIAGLILALISKVNGRNSKKNDLALVLGILGTVISLIFMIYSYATGSYKQ